ncbi:hypothetical protein DC3_42750 [Deinococcus cellulosilyticus NBRC 106333 = KACC 11606]|uniref:Uncharacterized protein n=1 Tax=Deinococcus cellulosilyticus (strain DSM 18568 / NBRC 106333 / KACC 11606 / 5516J-15) TaxID=1223518 RepID=A0A511N739_DEIC1|nr:hypothetical protein DC3_42750 [Deinococcus cellulosilyticus NBRC 106333 = KACC 11606]
MAIITVTKQQATTPATCGMCGAPRPAFTGFWSCPTCKQQHSVAGVRPADPTPHVAPKGQA